MQLEGKVALVTVAAEIEKMGRKAILVQGDVSKADVCAEIVDKVVNELGHIDILVNNAGITRDTLLLRMKEEDWDAVLNTNLKGVFNCTKAAVKYMAKQRSGSIVNISSVVALMGTTMRLPKQASLVLPAALPKKWQHAESA